MRLKLVVVTLAAGLLSSLTRAAVCPLPAEPHIPDGSTATGAQMHKAKKEIEAFQDGIDKYLECDSTPIKQRRAQQKIDAVMQRFKEQMELYRGK